MSKFNFYSVPSFLKENTYNTNSKSKLTEATWEESSIHRKDGKVDMVQEHKNQCQKIIDSINLYNTTY